MEYIIVIFFSYLIGAIPTGLLVSRRYNLDIRKHGSGNIGATNTIRLMGKRAGIVVGFIDILKGALPTLIALLYGGDLLGVIAGISAVIGHSYSVFANFKGGKSVLTGAGVVLVFNPLSVLLAVIVFIITLLITKYASVSSIAAAISIIIFVWILDESLVVQITVIFLVAFIIYRHHSNILRLIKGVEGKMLKGKNK